MLSLLFSLLSSIPGIVNGVTNVLVKRADADVAKNGQNVSADQAINIAVVQGRLEELKIEAATRAADRESLWTAWMMPAMFIVCFTHFSAVVFDSMPLLGHDIGTWHIARIPGEYAGIEIGVLATVAGIKTIGGVATVVKKVFSR